MKKERISFTLVLTVALFFLILSASIAVPLLCRPFYYAHISALKLDQLSGHTAAEIREAYNQMMDFCMKGKPFGTGILRWSEEGKAHFADCAVLFLLDIKALVLSSAVLICCLPIHIFAYSPKRILGRGPMFWAGSLLAGSFVVISALAASNFSRAFVVFHQLFFPGKENWIFDPRYDEIINVLPEVFFRNCAILIVGLMFLLCAGFIAADFAVGRKSK